MKPSNLNLTHDASMEADQSSAILIGLWMTLLAMIGLPMNIFVIVSTFVIPQNDFTPVYWADISTISC